MTDEKWLPVVGAEGRYEVSNTGRVRGRVGYLGRIEDYWTERRLFPVLGYMVVRITSAPNYTRLRRVHQLVAEAFVGPRPPGMQVNHKDLNKLNNSAENLEWVTPGDNTRHAARAGRIAHGVDHRSAKLTPADVLVICSSGESRDALARRYGVSLNSIAAVQTGRTWKHVDAPRRRKLSMFGLENNKSKLNPESVAAIRASSESLSALGRRYGVSAQSVRAVRMRKVWRSVP